MNVSGRLESRSYEAKDGTKRYVTEIISDHVEVAEWNNEGTPREETKGYSEAEDDGEILF